MRTIKFSVILMLIAQIASAETIYGVPFDYKKFESAREYFQKENVDQIEHFCKNDVRSTMDLSTCSQFEYEKVNGALTRRLLEAEKEIKNSDQSYHAPGDAYTWPCFRKAQNSWQTCRDNECYAEVYEAGPASMRFMDFWDCMTRITRLRLDEISPSKNQD